jgi:xanthine dehydrogenase YagS FAD-binding subunit
MAPPLIALKAAAVIASSEGERKTPLASFFLNPIGLGETGLKPDELLVAIEVPYQEATHQVFVKHRIRRAADFALASVALVARVTDGTCADISVVLGGVAPVPYVAAAAEVIMKGRRPDDALAGEAAEASVGGARPLPMNGYKVDLTKTLVKRALMSMVG